MNRAWQLFAVSLVAMSLLPGGLLEADKTQELLNHVDVQQGLCVLLGEQNGELAVELAQKTELTVYVQSVLQEDVRAARQTADDAGLLGTRVYVEQGNWSRIHLADNLADTVVVNGSAKSNTGNSPFYEQATKMR